MHTINTSRLFKNISCFNIPKEHSYFCVIGQIWSIIGNVLKREWVLSFGHWWSGQQKSVHLTTWQSARRPIISDKSSFNLAALTFSFYHQQELRDWSLLKHGGGARLGWTDNYVSVQTLPALPIQDATSFNGRSEQKMKLLRGRHGQRGCNCQG